MAIINDGFSTTINLTGAGVTFKEKEVTPPGVDGGGENDTTTMRNIAWRTKAPKKLKTMSELSSTVVYDPSFFTTIVANINVNQQIVVTFADGGTLTFWGWLNTFTPGPASEGAQPTADMVMIASNQDNSGTEQAPVIS